MLVSFNWLKDYLGDTKLTAAQAADLLGQHAFEIEGVVAKGEDFVIDVDVLPNRSSDSLCHRGIAREIASIVDKPLATDPLTNSPELTETDLIEIDIKEEEACPRFTASLLTDVTVKESPAWLKNRLETIGQKSINNIVDATNYVMFALGQPLHAYDADLFPQVAGKWRFCVRYAKEGETVELIAEGGKNEARVVELTGSELLIVDQSSNRPISLAGVKGGSFAGVHLGTKKVIIEAAHFDPVITRRTARRLGIVIDASKRFENEPSRELPPFAQFEIIKLIKDIAGGNNEGTVDKYLKAAQQPEVTVSTDQVNNLLGITISGEEMKKILEQVGCTVKLEDKTLVAKGPWERTDLKIAEDFIEEIGRIYGYEHIKSVLPEKISLNEINKKHYYSEKIRHVLLSLGFSEVITSSFRKKDEIQLLNALASDKSYLRSNLKQNILEALDKNAPHTDLLGADDTRIFEIGTVFQKDKDNYITEHTTLSLGVRIKSSGYSGKEDGVVKTVLEKVAEELQTTIDWDLEKGVAEVNLSELLEKLPEPTSYEAFTAASTISYKPFSMYPSMSRDIALWVSENTKADMVEKVLTEAAGDLLVRTRLFDEFSKEGKLSLAFRMVFQSPEKTLTDEEVNGFMEKVYTAVAKEGWEVR